MLLTTVANASELIKINPVTNRILQLKFSDGYINYHGLGQTAESDIAVNSPLDLEKAVDTASYLIFSESDNNYTIAKFPTAVGRKSKGQDFSANYGAGTPVVLEHYIYLLLPHALQDGETYTIQINNFENSDCLKLSYTFNSYKVYSGTIHVNQIGYATNAPIKSAYLSNWMGNFGSLDLSAFANKKFYLVTADDAAEQKFESTIVKRTSSNNIDDGFKDSYSKADVYTCDFSNFKTEGEYILVVPGIGSSYPFRIDGDAYREPFYNIIRALYLQRCGVAIEESHTKWTRGRCHHPDDTGKEVILTTWRHLDGGTNDGAFEQLPAHATDSTMPFFGGYHDAGDWDRWHNHLTGTMELLTVYEFKPENFSDNELNIPESGNGIPDLLDEAKWNVEFYRQLQGSDGGVKGGIETSHHPGQGKLAENDNTQWYAYAADPLASYHYAASAAQLAYCLEIAGDTSMKATYISSAKAAYNWAQDSTRVEDTLFEIRDMRQLAAAWLYKTTGDEKYQTQFKADNKITTTNTKLVEWNKLDQELATITYVNTNQPGIDASLKMQLTSALKNYATKEYVNTANKRGYRFGAPWWVPVGWGQATTPRLLATIAAYEVSNDSKYLSCLHSTTDYVLGGNPLNMCWVTGIGENSPRNILHVDSWYSHLDLGIIPGLIPWGPFKYSKGTSDPWSIYMGLNSTYPKANQWPSHELWFENRYSPNTNEFVTNNVARMAAIFGYLAESSGVFIPEDIEQLPDSTFNIDTSACIEIPTKSSDLFLPQLHLKIFPNPFNNNLSISFFLNKKSNVNVTVYDISGRKISQLADFKNVSGKQNLIWDGTDSFGKPISFNMYFIKIVTSQTTVTKKVVFKQ